MYYYVYNLQGDVTHIIDANKNIVGTYQYDAWGKILNLGSLTAIAQANPFRYRGYYYDNESGLYYLNSRYYNAEWGRFINADGYVSTGQGITGYNMFAYCENNPVMNADYTGALSMPATFKFLNITIDLTTNIEQTIRSEEQKRNAKNDKNIDRMKSAFESTVTTLFDDFCNFVTPVKSVLLKTSSMLGKSIEFMVDKIGYASAFALITDIAWDYNTYGFSEEFVTSACITVSFVCLGVIAGSVITAAPWLVATKVVVSIGVGMLLSDWEDKYRNFVFG